MMHAMKLQAEHFNLMRDVKKVIELRLYDEKRRAIQLGDVITFTNQADVQETLQVTVTGLSVYPTFSDLFRDFDESYFGMPTERLLTVLETYYPIEEQKKHAVVGIRFALVSH
jgi:ASC-1-like (ASCH) protein